jgi:hypothetical protein
MNLRRTEKHEPLAPLRRLEVKAKPFLPVNGEVFPLTSPFIERGYRKSGGPFQELVPAIVRHKRPLTQSHPSVRQHVKNNDCKNTSGSQSYCSEQSSPGVQEITVLVLKRHHAAD